MMTKNLDVTITQLDTTNASAAWTSLPQKCGYWPCVSPGLFNSLFRRPERCSGDGSAFIFMTFSVVVDVVLYSRERSITIEVLLIYFYSRMINVTSDDIEDYMESQRL